MALHRPPAFAAVLQAEAEANCECFGAARALAEGLCTATASHLLWALVGVGGAERDTYCALARAAPPVTS